MEAKTVKSNMTDMTQGSPARLILFFALPLLVGNMFQQLYNMVDSIVVGRFVGSTALAAVGTAFPVVFLLSSMFMGLGIGAMVMVSQFYGAGDAERLKATIDTIYTALIVGIVPLSIVGILVSRPIIALLAVPADTADQCWIYMVIVLGGLIGSLGYNANSGILQGLGDSKTPLLFLVIACIINIVLDLLFVVVFHWGVAGVAIATIMAQAVSSFMVMHKLMHTREDYKVEIRKIRFHKKMIRKIIAFGFPAACQQSITSFSNVVVQSYINGFGTAAMAGYSATLRIDGFLQLPLQSFNMAITTFVGQNIGARKYKRVKKGIFAAWVMSSLIILAGSVGMYFGAPLLISVFTNDPQVIANGSGMLRIFSRAYIALAVVQVLNGALRGAGLSKVPMFFMLGCFVVLRQIYLMIAVPMTHSLMVVMAGWPITWVICAAGMFLYYVRADWLPQETGMEGKE